MSAQSLFSKKNIESQQLDARRGILEELNLPPALIAFIRKNSRILQIAAGCVVVVVLAWVIFDYYTEIQEKKGASLLATGLQTEAAEQRVEVLESVIRDYGRTDAARWSKLELAHLDFKAGKFDTAAGKYKEIVDSLPTDISLVPLTRLNMAQSYEQAGQYDQAIPQYELLKKSIGFASQAYLALGRIYMMQGEAQKARKAYEELLSSQKETVDPVLISQVEAKLALLDASSPAITSQPEERKE